MNSEIMELSSSELNCIAGADMAFYGMNCSLNQSEAIGKVVDGLGAIPVIGGVLAAAATFIGRAYCGGL